MLRKPWKQILYRKESNCCIVGNKETKGGENENKLAENEGSKETENEGEEVYERHKQGNKKQYDENRKKETMTG